MARAKVISIADFKRERRERMRVARKDMGAAKRSAFLAAEATTVIAKEVATFWVLFGAAWALVAFNAPLWQSTGWGWLSAWAVYIVAGAVLIHYAKERLLGFLATAVYFVTAAALLFSLPWFGVAMLAPFVPHIWLAYS
ncbi:MAG: hypothetical protein WA957_14625 [Alteraurantiacibacter sp.]